jgi:Tfp pilus assembly ATPase PilU
MILLDDFLYNLFLQKKITYQTMMSAAQNPADLEQKIKEYTYAAASKK